MSKANTFNPVPLDIKKALDENPEIRAEYEALGSEFELLDTLLNARNKAGMTQLEVAEAMGVKRPSIARLESASPKHSPSVRTLHKYAEALGCKLEIKLIPQK